TVGVLQKGVTYSRPPFYALLLKPFAWGPYLTAYASFQVLSLGCLAAFLWLRRNALLYACFSLPLAANFIQGQDLCLVLLALAFALILIEKQQDFAAGAVLSLGAIKFHLFLPLPLIFLVQRRWRILGGGLIGGSALVLLSVLAQGPGWVRQY